MLIARLFSFSESLIGVFRVTLPLSVRESLTAIRRKLSGDNTGRFNRPDAYPSLNVKPCLVRDSDGFSLRVPERHFAFRRCDNSLRVVSLIFISMLRLLQ